MLLLLFNDSLSAVVVTKDLEDCQTKYCNKNKLALQPPNNEQINGFAAKKFRSSHVSCMCVCTLMYELGDKSVDFRNFKQNAEMLPKPSTLPCTVRYNLQYMSLIQIPTK